MRAYQIFISDPNTGEVKQTYSSLSAGNPNLSALNIEIDIPLFDLSQPSGNATLRVWGIPLKEIAQAANHNGRKITMFAGMAKGLPLANPKQYGLILTGTINQCFGNWQDTNQHLDFVILALPNNSQGNVILNWKAGTTLSSAIQQSLASAYPGYTFIDNSKRKTELVIGHDESAAYENITQFAQQIKRLSQYALKEPTYQGLKLTIANKKFILNDGTSATSPAAITFTDLIGQPTWISTNQVQFKTVMRSDLNVFDYVTLPSGQQTSTVQTRATYRNSSIFAGTFQIYGIRHVGNFRQSDGNSWVTVFDVSTA